MRIYIESVISLAFFRVIEFKKIFLECIAEKTGYDIPEWKNIDWDINDYFFDSDQESLVKLFDWQENFFKYIPESDDKEEFEKHVKKLQ